MRISPAWRHTCTLRASRRPSSTVCESMCRGHTANSSLQALAARSHERWSTVGLHCLMGPVGSTRRGVPPSHGSVAAVRSAAAALINTPKP